MKDSKVFDSSVWLEFIINGNYKDIIEKDELFILSTLSLFEIKKKLINQKYKEDDINKAISYIKSKNIILPPEIDMVEKAVDVSIKNKLATVDSIIYATALISNAQLITLDNDFRNLPHITIL